MKYLSRNDLETIGGRVIAAYKRLPAISGQALERVDIDYLCQELLGLHIDYARLSLNGEKIGLTSSCDIGVEVFSEDPSSTEEQYYMLDGKTILIESDLMKEGANISRRNYTVSHESCHHILKMLFPHDYGAQASGRSVHCCYRSNRGNGDWEEWQVETLAAMILLPPECVVRSMERFGLGTQMRLLNRVFAPADYKKFEAMASFMGASKTALSIRMTQLYIFIPRKQRPNGGMQHGQMAWLHGGTVPRWSMVQHRPVASTRKWTTQTPLSVYCAGTRYSL